jgi:hypothetical protein
MEPVQKIVAELTFENRAMEGLLYLVVIRYPFLL